MATIGKDPNGRRRILFVAGDGKRKTVRLFRAAIRKKVIADNPFADLKAHVRGRGPNTSSRSGLATRRPSPGSTTFS